MTTALVPVAPVTKEGKEKTVVATVLGVIFGVLTAGSTFVTPDSTTGHIITAGLGLVGLLATTLGVYIVPNSKVQVATVAIKDAVVASTAAVQDVAAELAPPPPFTDADRRRAG